MVAVAGLRILLHALACNLLIYSCSEDVIEIQSVGARFQMLPESFSDCPVPCTHSIRVLRVIFVKVLCHSTARVQGKMDDWK